MSLLLTALAVIVLWTALVSWRRKNEAAPTAPAGPGNEDDGIDRAALEAAEREVRDMDSNPRGGAKDEAVGDDWGPGTPKTPMG